MELSINSDKNVKCEICRTDWFDCPNVGKSLRNARQLNKVSRKKRRDGTSRTVSFDEREREREKKEKEKQGRQVAMIVTHRWGHRSITVDSVAPIKADRRVVSRALARSNRASWRREYQHALPNIIPDMNYFGPASRALSRGGHFARGWISQLGGNNEAQPTWLTWPRGFRDSRGGLSGRCYEEMHLVSRYSRQNRGKRWFGRIGASKKGARGGSVLRKLADDSESSCFSY